MWATRFIIRLGRKKKLFFYSPFPEVAESVQEEVETYKAQEDEVKRLKTIMVRDEHKHTHAVNLGGGV